MGSLTSFSLTELHFHCTSSYKTHVFKVNTCQGQFGFFYTFGHNNKMYVWRRKSEKARTSSLTLYLLTSMVVGSCVEVEVMKKEDYI